MNAPAHRLAAAIVCLAACGCVRGGMPTSAPPVAASAAGGRIKLDSQAQELAEVVVRRAEVRAVVVRLIVSGSLNLDDRKTAVAGTLATGRVEQVLVSVGDVVKPDQVLALVHSHEIHNALAEYQTARANLVRRQRMVDYARRVRDRYRSLYAVKFASAQEAEQAEVNLRNAKTDLEDAQFQLQAARAHLAALLQVPEATCCKLDPVPDFIPIKTTRAGVVLARNVEPGTIIQPGDKAFVVSDISDLWMIAAVSEEDLPKLRVGMPASVRVRAYPDASFPGVVVLLGGQLDPVTRTLPVRIDVPNGDERLRPGMYATAEIAGAQSRKALFLPEGAVQELDGNPVVFVRTDDSWFEARPVKTGQRVNGEIEITRGLKPGETVVVKGGFVLKSQLLKNRMGQ